MNKIIKSSFLVILLVLTNSCSNKKTIKFEITNATDYVLDLTIRAGCKDSEGLIDVSLSPHERSEIQTISYKGCAAELFSESHVKGEIKSVSTTGNQKVDMEGSWLYGRDKLEQNALNKVSIKIDSTGRRLIFALMN